MAAGQVLFERDTIAFAQAPAPFRDRTEAMDAPDIFVSHDARGAIRLICLPVTAADSRRFDFENAGVRRNVREGILADLCRERANCGCGQYVFGHVEGENSSFVLWRARSDAVRSNQPC